MSSEFTKGDQETLENHADWLEDQGGQNREIASMLRALLADRDEIEADRDAAVGSHHAAMGRIETLEAEVERLKNGRNEAMALAQKNHADHMEALAEVERLKADLSAGLGPEETVFITNENVALRSEVERLAHLATTEENRARDAEEKVERLKAELADEAAKACKYQAISDQQRESIDAALALVKGMHCYAKSGDGRCLHCAMVTALSCEGGSEWVSK